MKRREFNQLLALAAASIMTPAVAKQYEKGTHSLIKKTISSTGEKISAIGMGSSRTFDVASTENELAVRTEILRIFFNNGGQMIDSSPMYGRAENVLGHCLKQLAFPPQLFSATKVWTDGEIEGITQMNKSLRLWNVNQFQLMQIHNLKDWKTHIKTLRDWKEKQRIKYIGITTSHGLRHQEFESVMKSEKPDFIQLTYNISNRQVEERLLPLAQDLGISVIVNRPFMGLFSRIKGKPLPDMAADIQCTSWAQFFLKFVISHPAVTCAIPATSKEKHMHDNMQAAYGDLPDLECRQQMIRAFHSIN